METPTKMRECFVLLEPITPKQSLALSAELRNVINERNMLTSKSKKKFLSALEEINSADVESKRKSMKNQAVQEILDSELTYLRRLEQIMNFFMAPLRMNNLIKDDEFETLFGSIETIYKVNGELLNELKSDLMNVASAFSKLAPYFKMYSVYAYNYTKCLSTLETLYQKNKEFAKFISNQETRPEVQNKLSSLLITPIQRIPRYGLLLQQVLDNTVPMDKDYEVLQDSLEKLGEVARHVNSLVADRENSQRLLELLRTLKDGKSLIIQAGRKLIKEGILKHYINSKVAERVYLVLMSDILMICKFRKSKITLPKSLKCETIYPLHKCTVTNNRTTMMFEVSCQDHSTVLYHDKNSESDEWIKTINKSIDACIRNRSTLKKGCSARRPGIKNNLESYKDHGLSPGMRRVLKRRRTDEESPEIKSKGGKVMKLETSKSSIAKWRLSKRRSLHQAFGDVNSTTTTTTTTSTENRSNSGKKLDCLFPLREHFMANGDHSNDANDRSMDLVPQNEEVFVFGKEDNAHRGFSFRIGNIFTGIGNTVKRVLGFN